MKTKRKNADAPVDIEQSRLPARRRTELLQDGAYLFQDEMEGGGDLTIRVITCAAWLLELIELRAGEICFLSGKQEIRPNSDCFGIFYPPFSITQPCFKNPGGRLLGVAATAALPKEVTRTPMIFELPALTPPRGVAEAIEMVRAGENRQPIEAYPKPSLLSLKAKRLIDLNYLVYPSIARIAERLWVTHAHLTRQFKLDFEMSPSAYLRQLRLADVPLRFARGEEIIEVSHDVGYNDLSRFYKQFRKTTNTSPGACKSLMRPRRSKSTA
jgi:AraC-like DNA-binding protein